MMNYKQVKKIILRIPFFYFWTFMFLSVSSGFAKTNALQTAQFDLLLTRMERYALTDVSKANALIDSLRAVASELSDGRHMLMQCTFFESVVNFNQGRNDSAMIPKIEKQMQLLDNTADVFEKGLLNFSLSSAYYGEGDYAKSFLAALHALEQFEALKNNLLIVHTQMLLGIICNNIRNFDMAEDYYNHALALSGENLFRLHRIKMNIYTIRYLMGKGKNAIDSLEALIPMLNAKADVALLVSTYLNLGALYFFEQKPQELWNCCEKLSPLMKEIHNNRLLLGFYQNLGAYYVLNREPEKALECLSKAKNISIRDRNWGSLLYTYLQLSDLYEKTGIRDSSFLYLKYYKALNDEKIDRSKLLDVYRAYVSTALESSQKELTIAEQKLQLKNRSLIITIAFALAIILVITLFLVLVQQKKRLKEAENKDLEELLQAKQQMESLQKERIEAQSREITSHALMLSNKNQVLQQLSEVAGRLPKKLDEYQEINQIIKNNLNVDHAWNGFMMHFEQVHPDFFNRLTELSKGLTENNLRLCAYFRLGIPLKQIAQILNISHGSILIQRYRLKKKLGLIENEDLDEFIRNV